MKTLCLALFFSFVWIFQSLTAAVVELRPQGKTVPVSYIQKTIEKIQGGFWV